MQISKKIKGIAIGLLTLLVVIAGVQLTSFVMVPYGSKSQVMWSEFNKQENLDTVIIGTSLSERAFDPRVLDGVLGTNSFNMCTPSQETPESFIALREAASKHNLKRVIYGIDFANYQGAYDMYPGRVLMNEKWHWENDSPFEIYDDLAYALDNNDWLFDEKSINWLFPWTEQYVKDGLKSIPRNVVMQLDGTPFIRAAEINEKGWHYYGRGYANYDDVYNRNTDTYDNFATRFNGSQFDAKKIEKLLDACDFCRENGIEFIGVAPPLPDYSYIGMHKIYDEMTREVQRLVEEHGGTYYDFNLMKPEFYVCQEWHHADCQHMNSAGGAIFSGALAKLMLMHEAGEDTSKLFWTYEERLRSMEYTAMVHYTSEVTADAIKLHMRSFGGRGYKIEYQVQVMKPSSDEFEVVRDWSTDANYDYPAEEKGVYKVRVCGRGVGKDVPYEKYAEHNITF